MRIDLEIVIGLDPNGMCKDHPATPRRHFGLAGATISPSASSRSSHGGLKFLKLSATMRLTSAKAA